MVSEMMNKKILITGHTGFIGRCLVDRFIREGALVTGLSLDEVDLLDAEHLQLRIRQLQPDIVYHLAACRERSLSEKTLIHSLEVNLLGTANLFNALLQVEELEQVVFLGTAEEYGNTERPFSEKNDLAPVTPYSLSKACVSMLGQYFFRIYKMPLVAVRPTVAYGPGQSTDMFIPALITSLSAGQAFAMSSGEQSRDFIFIDDLVDFLAELSGRRDLSGEILNAGSGDSVKLAVVAQMIAREMEGEHLLQLGQIKDRVCEIMDYRVDMEKTIRLTGWQTKVDLSEGISRTIEFYLGK